jgi:hypothetical protein
MLFVDTVMSGLLISCPVTKYNGENPVDFCTVLFKVNCNFEITLVHSDFAGLDSISVLNKSKTVETYLST